MTQDFNSLFSALTGNLPFPWQTKLYERFISGSNSIPTRCAIPTGLGKTSVVAIWLLAREACHSLPRRLVYVVNRRTVVDQTTSEVERYKAYRPDLAISTLRGQYADNREWSADPSRPAVICGTVDMIGSRLLFSGYGVGFKGKPLHAGFLGQDVLLVHDEAHLEPAFQKLIEAVRREQDRCKEFEKFHVMELTATTRSGTGQPEKNEKQRNEKPFELTDEEKRPPEKIPGPTSNEPPIYRVWRRLKAHKKLCLTSVEEDNEVANWIAKVAASYKDANVAVLVFVRTLKAVEMVEKALKKTGRPVVLLTGTMRGKERDDLVQKPEFKRFLKGAAPGDTVYLVCTSAGEVGIDISADHMVCDLSTFESMAQRFGRVNRYGERSDTRIDVVYPLAFDEKDDLTPARKITLALLHKLDGNASPLNLGSLDARERQAGFAPEPNILPATDILFDAWSLTSIRGKMPGRPEVAPYLHGIADDFPQTTIAWRVELDLLKDDPDPRSKLKAIFTKHRIRPHESLTVNSRHVVTFLKVMTAPKVRPDLLSTRVALIFARNIELKTVEALIENPELLNVDPTLVLPASFGGLDEMGMLNVPKSGKQKQTEVSGDAAVTAEATEGTPVAESTLDIADFKGYEREKDAQPRRRVIVERTKDQWSAKSILGAGLSADWDLEDAYEKSTQLFNEIRWKSGLRVRLVQDIKFDEEGDAVCCLVCLSPPPKQGSPAEEQALVDHVNAVEKEACRLADELLKHDKVANAALRFAAKWHDEGKRAGCWQRYIGGPHGDGQPLGKSAKWRDPRLLAGYRHEFGSLLRIPDDEAARFFADPKWKLNEVERASAIELALHLIVAHHGYARPHFVNLLGDGSTTAKCEQIHLDVIRRFARLQRRYGRWGLAYLESLLRAADAAASRAIGIDPETDDEEDATEDEATEQ